jgi:hypothetical protein
MALQDTTLQSLLHGGTTLTHQGIPVQFNVNQSKSVVLTNGTGTDQADEATTLKTTAITAGATYDLNAMTSPFGTIDFATIKVLRIVNNSTTASENIVVGNAASTPFLGPLSAGTTTITIPPGNYVEMTNRDAGWSTTGANNLKIASTLATPEFELTIVGVKT